MRKRNGIRLVGVARTEGFCPMETTMKSAPHDKQDGEEALSFDPTTPPAQVDVHAFARRAGEITLARRKGSTEEARQR